ncbi:hypothetical protein ASG52_00340 [Methylobacterium sp. Leaf456]|uniref:hypothetical protein n=1 Tax=Methylobacterium sp. Leaf456 TaxID=1736382 RepID=UPI0006F916E4|nr:hypothetical protein [Methylobacterium sp. Leaf456]KQT61375.1 hypothetical protein ASG52_00340 [Methylobacterium sp. Leaf456]
MRPAARRALLTGGLALGWLAAGFGCDTATDARRAVLCRRALPALAPNGTTARLLRVGPGSGPGSVRVDYRLADADGALLKGEGARVRFLSCAFGPGTEMTALTTERGPVSGASLYLLRRYFLETPEAEAADPGKSSDPAKTPEGAAKR